MNPFFEKAVAMAIAKGIRVVKTPPCPCAFCGYAPTSVVVPYGRQAPEEGDFIICPGCAIVMVFAADLTRAPMTWEVYGALPPERVAELERGRAAHMAHDGPAFFRGTPGPWPPAKPEDGP